MAYCLLWAGPALWERPRAASVGHPNIRSSADDGIEVIKCAPELTQETINQALRLPLGTLMNSRPPRGDCPLKRSGCSCLAQCDRCVTTCLMWDTPEG
jgi:hypothetical protein